MNPGPAVESTELNNDIKKQEYYDQIGKCNFKFTC